MVPLHAIFANKKGQVRATRTRRAPSSYNSACWAVAYNFRCVVPDLIAVIATKLSKEGGQGKCFKLNVFSPLVSPRMPMHSYPYIEGHEMGPSSNYARVRVVFSSAHQRRCSYYLSY